MKVNMCTYCNVTEKLNQEWTLLLVFRQIFFMCVRANKKYVLEFACLTFTDPVRIYKFQY